MTPLEAFRNYTAPKQKPLETSFSHVTYERNKAPMVQELTREEFIDLLKDESRSFSFRATERIGT